MYLKDKVRTLKAKLTIDQDDFLVFLADSYGVTKSEALRIIIDSARLGGDFHG